MSSGVLLFSRAEANMGLWGALLFGLAVAILGAVIGAIWPAAKKPYWIIMGSLWFLYMVLTLILGLGL